MSLLQLGDNLQAKFLKNSAFGRLEDKICASGRCALDILSKWAMMFAGCCPRLPLSNGEEKLIGSQKMSAEEISGLRKVFDTFDANKDGFLTLEELCSWMEKIRRPMTKESLFKILQSCDWNSDGRLDFNEFVALTQTLHHDHNSGEDSRNVQSHLGTCNGDEGEEDAKSELKEAFEVFDKDGNGLISPSELRATLCELGLLSSSGCLSRIHSMIKKVDVDGDGQVSFSEFETMMNGK